MKKKLIALLTACMFALCTVTSALALDKVSLPATSTATAAPAQSKRIEKKMRHFKKHGDIAALVQIGRQRSPCSTIRNQFL